MPSKIHTKVAVKEGTTPITYLPCLLLLNLLVSIKNLVSKTVALDKSSNRNKSIYIHTYTHTYIHTYSGAEEGRLGEAEPPTCDLMGVQPPSTLNSFGIKSI